MLDKVKKMIEENPFLNKNKRYIGAGILLVCFIVMLRILKNMKIAQALKMGED